MTSHETTRDLLTCLAIAASTRGNLLALSRYEAELARLDASTAQTTTEATA